MKLEAEEYVHKYSLYEFGYRIWCIPEQGDDLDDIYVKGFLPYSGNERPTPRYYACRSARVRLERFALSSENRRILKKFDGRLTWKVMTGKEALASDGFAACALRYFSERHGPGIMSPERLKVICEYSPHVRIWAFSSEGKEVAYIIEHHGKRTGHYWFSFYDLSFAFQGFGMWLMITYTQALKEKGLEYAYLGTVYGPRALYKANLEPIEFFDGTEWVHDLKKLKHSARNEAHT